MSKAPHDLSPALGNHTLVSRVALQR
jgi:hypothetical protein